MEENNRKSNWDNYLEGQTKSFLGTFYFLGLLIGLYMAYMSYSHTFKVSELMRVVIIVFSLTVSFFSFYSLFKKKSR